MDKGYKQAVIGGSLSSVEGRRENATDSSPLPLSTLCGGLTIGC